MGLCGFPGDGMACKPVLATPPAVLKQNVLEGASGSWSKGCFRQAARHFADGAAGPILLGKSAALLFLEAMCPPHLWRTPCRLAGGERD